MTKRDPHPDNEIIDQMAENGGISQQGAAGHNVNRQVGARDELKQATGGDPLPTSPDGRDKMAGGDQPNPPEHRQ